MLVPEGGEIEVDVENLSQMGIVRVVIFLDLIFFYFPVLNLVPSVTSAIIYDLEMTM